MVAKRKESAFTHVIVLSLGEESLVGGLLAIVVLSVLFGGALHHPNESWSSEAIGLIEAVAQ